MSKETTPMTFKTFQTCWSVVLSATFLFCGCASQSSKSDPTETNATKLYVRGKVNLEVERLIAANSRIPVETLGDLRGQVGACRVGAER